MGPPATTAVLQRTDIAQSFVRNFNPFASRPLVPTLAGIYEPLMIYNMAKGELVPWLADKYAFSADNKTLTFTLHDGVKWSDGQPFTAQDVAFTFNLLKNKTGLQGPGLQALGASGYIDSVAAPDDKTVVFTFKVVNTPGLYDIIGQNIVPEHLWKDVADPAKYTNDNPVGTGPFTQVTVFQNQAYGPLPEDMVGQEVRLRVTDHGLQVRTDNRILAVYPLEVAELVPMDETATVGEEVTSNP